MEAEINNLIQYFKKMETKSFKRNSTVENNNEKNHNNKDSDSF